MPEPGHYLLWLARSAIAQQLKLPLPIQPTINLPDYPMLNQPAATFVTLTQQGKLRGCIGSLEARHSLTDDIRYNAQAAAFRDPRFTPLAAHELANTRIEVSLLSKAVPMQFDDETDALAQLRPGIDGVILRAGLHRATFLPQVWEQLPSPKEFLAHLKRKANLPADYWGKEVELSKYDVRKFREA